jgi:SAM-dependent methyltransferase
LSPKDDAHREAESFFEGHWRKDDPWAFDTSPYEQGRLDFLRDVVADRHYRRVLELGCGAGHFTERLLPFADSVLGLDISAAAIEKAKARVSRSSSAAHVDLQVANVMETDLRAEAPFDLVALTETVYYLGWLYSFFKVAWLARDLYEVTSPGGRLLLANTLGEIGDALVLPWIVRGYHDVFRNAGYETEREETFRGVKDGVALEVLVSLLRKP